MAFRNTQVNGQFPQCAAASAARVVYVVVTVNVN
jgi:hypothetical protein